MSPAICATPARPLLRRSCRTGRDKIKVGVLPGPEDDVNDIRSHADEVEHGYHRVLRELQIELVKFQRHLIKRGERLLVLLEGRDAAGKDASIKRIVEHLSPRETRVMALPAPSSREQTEWYFQRYVEHLPAAAEFVLFNRSWYNRAGVERVMGFCTNTEVEKFFEDSPVFERMLVNSAIRLFKYYLDIDRDEQKKRL